MVTHAGGVAVRERDGIVEVAIVTSSSGTGWVLPKGAIDPGETAVQAAVREVEEEAGLVCEAIVSLGDAPIVKHGRTAETEFFLMRVLRVDVMTEDRELRWCDLATARDMLAAPGAKLVIDRAGAYLDRDQDS